jgi:hypothetical protein
VEFWALSCTNATFRRAKIVFEGMKPGAVPAEVIRNSPVPDRRSFAILPGMVFQAGGRGGSDVLLLAG